MRHLRSDYDAIQPFPTQRPHNVKIDGKTVAAGDEHLGRHMEPIIPDDEPVFILRARDITAPDTIYYWANSVEIRGGDKDLCDRVRAWADEMAEYGRKHGRKTPDTPKDYLR